MDFDFDVFVSYAHLDDAALSEERKGWVAKLHETLDQRLSQLLGKPVRIWRDPKLHGNDEFGETIVTNVQHAAVLLSIVSPRYVRSEWTTRELSEFCKAAERQGGVQIRDRSRIFKVVKTPVPLGQQVPPLPLLLGYNFYRVDPGSGSFREFDERFGIEYRQQFMLKLDDLAQDVTALLLELIEGQNETDRQPGQAIYLAETTLDVQEQHDAIRRELQQHGHTVLPTRALRPIGTEVSAAVREDLARCRMSIHLVGRNYSLVPEGGESSLVEIQNDAAIERAGQGGFTRLVWIPPDLQVDDLRQRQVIDRFRADPRAAQASDLLETPFEDLRTVIREVLERDPAPAPPATPDRSISTPPSVARVYLLYDKRDADVVSPWTDFLFDQGLEIRRPAFTGDEADVRAYHEENLREAAGVVIFFGASGEPWVVRKLSELQKIVGYGRTKPAPTAVVCVLSPRTPEKETFRSHEAIVVPQYDGLSRDSWLPIVRRLKG